MCPPVHETVRSSHWVGVPTVTLNARTAEIKVMHEKERMSGDVRMVKKMKGGIKRDAEVALTNEHL